jgi:hypothetical protein
MAYLDDLTDEERAREEQGGSAPAMGGAAAGGGGSSAPAPSSGFANLSNYFTANKDAATAQGAGLMSSLEGRAKDALDKEDAGEAQNVLGQLDAATTPGGIASVTGNDNGAGYTAGMAGLDGYLSTRGGGGDFGGLRDLYGDKLSNVRSGYTAPTAPGDRYIPNALDWAQGDNIEQSDDGEAAGEIAGGAASGAMTGGAVAGPVGAVVGGIVGGATPIMSDFTGGPNPWEDYGAYANAQQSDYNAQVAQYRQELAAYNEYLKSIGKEPIPEGDVGEFRVRF